ncbi:MAG: hypothetical protein KAJ18_10225 [Candidatus Omnitrophica bacterium]|nr:hypothetical protein [Candidatus Omnitrophota bacterium]
MSFRMFKKKFLVGVVGCCLAFSLSGCVYLVVGGVGALGGYVVSPDTVEGVVAGGSRAMLWDSAIEVISVMGIIEEKTDSGGVMIAKVNRAKVTITVSGMGGENAKLMVKARRMFIPKVKMAQDIYVKIIDHAKME